VAIINHNDAMAGSERTDLRDNDLLACRTIEAIREHSGLAVARAVFLSNTRGVLDADGRTVQVTRMARDDHASHDRVFASLSRHVTDEKSSVGTGGLASKLATARRLVRGGVAVTLACYRDSLADILDDRSECTRLEFEECRT
jgi:glutamate 5-kinase